MTGGADDRLSGVVVAHDALADFCVRIMEAAGCDADEARAIGNRLIVANLTGHDSHGVSRVPRYVQMMGEGLVRPGQAVSVVSGGDAFLLLDGNRGFGQVIGEQAVALGCERAAAQGVAIVGLRNSGHLGRIGDWAEEAAAAGFVSVHFVNIRGRSLVAPFGGIDRRMATSPFAIGVPLSGEAPIILDCATSLVAEGKALNAAIGGPPLPQGALISADGTPTTDPAALYGDTLSDAVPNASRGPGALAVFGGHKGSGLNFMIEILAGALTGGGVNRTLNDLAEQPFSNGMLSIYLDPDRFAGREYFEREARDFAAYVHSARPAVGHDAVLIPGEKERRLRQERERDGVPLSAGAWRRLVATAEKLGVTHGVFDTPLD